MLGTHLKLLPTVPVALPALPEAAPSWLSTFLQGPAVKMVARVLLDQGLRGHCRTVTKVPGPAAGWAFVLGPPLPPAYSSFAVTV